MANDEVSQYLHGGQGQVGGPQVPLLGHGNDTDQNWAPASLGGMSHPLLPLS